MTVKSWRIRVCNPFYRLFFQKTENGLWNLWMRRYQVYRDAREWRSVFELKSQAFCNEIIKPSVLSYTKPTI
ncbi:hypothetical protein DPMN_181836 [Dreissena polymorpha]|uniref:Uncharacterized protein n=1 Tax=Dreissena polymorpha TaxID=45954 RepID=A0A9D4DF89_DREPO|nr:hypothetical protein DPMN_181836 [Dreissena polymorpha]